MSTAEITTLRGERELALRAAHLFLSARQEFACAATDLRTWALPEIREQIVAERRRTAPDLPVYKLFNPGALDDEESERHLVAVAAAGAQVRICTTRLHHETIMIDRKIVILAGPPESGDRMFTVVRSPDVINSVVSLYWASWHGATDLADFRRSRPPSLTDSSRQILRMLGAGYTDETAARRLGMSLRTYRRRVAELMTLLDAGSRFQAGMRARELGLIA